MKSRKKKPPMSQPIVISVINQSTKVVNADAEVMTHAVGKQLARDVAPIYGLVPALEFVPKGGKPSPGSCPCWIQDTPDVPGALGYHDEDDNGVPYIKIFAITGQVLKGSEALSVTLSHEVLELTGDPAANLWADGPGGADFSRELCDAVEGDTYEIDGVAVSNFVYPAFFDPKARAGSRFDFLGKLSKPFTMTSGGYQITRTEPGAISQVFAGHHHEEAAPGLHLHFGPAFPAHRRAGKVAKAARKRASRHV